MGKFIISASGYPADLDLLRRINDNSNSVTKSVASAVGDNTIISGVESDSTNISAGFIVYNGELLPFRTGVLQSRFKVVTFQHTGFYDGNPNTQVTYEEKWAEPTADPSGVLISSLFRIRALKDGVAHLGSATATIQGDGSGLVDITTTGLLADVDYSSPDNGANYYANWIFDPELVSGDYFVRIVEVNGATNYVNYDTYIHHLQAEFTVFVAQFKLEIFKYIKA